MLVIMWLLRPIDPLTSSDVADLRRFLILVADPRDARGLRYPALALLCAAVSAVLTGARSLIAISEWITDTPQHVLGVLGFAADPPQPRCPSSRPGHRAPRRTAVLPRRRITATAAASAARTRRPPLAYALSRLSYIERFTRGWATSMKKLSNCTDWGKYGK
ncbi:transposase family protein [Streptomyces sp. NPDC059371]|uniref:transposase family protein n=1 Tax=Streptomyces sp. NPDC059371 TaxID=3346812 RepID=UPI0036A091D0